MLLRPVLAQLHASDEKNKQKPWRVVFVMQANGFQPWAAQPKKLVATEAGPTKTVDLSLDDYELSEDMESLEDYKKLVTIIQRLSAANVRPSHSARFGALSGVLGRTAKAQTIDAALARLNPGTYPLVNLGGPRRTVRPKTASCGFAPLGDRTNPSARSSIRIWPTRPSSAKRPRRSTKEAGSWT